MPLLRLAPGGSETIGTLDVLDTNVGSEICDLDTCLFGRPLLPAARWGRPDTVFDESERLRSMGESLPSSSRGGVALAEYGGEERGDVPMLLASLGGMSSNWEGAAARFPDMRPEPSETDRSYSLSTDGRMEGGDRPTPLLSPYRLTECSATISRSSRCGGRLLDRADAEVDRSLR